jgi:hypothetical protein
MVHLSVAGAVLILPSIGKGCACGCGVFDVGTSQMLPQGTGGMAFVEFDFQDQNRNWANSGPAPAANNNDKEIRTDFTTIGLQYFFNRSWGIQAELPYVVRDFKTLGGPMGNTVQKFVWGSVGDLRLEGYYTGFSPDLSSGLTFGLKLPTGNFAHNDAYGDIDRDSEIGTGSTDVLLGGYFRHPFFLGNRWTWFAQGLVDIPVLTQDQYRPGGELDAAVGLYYQGWMLHRLRITPIAQVIGSVRTSDSGDFASGGLDSNPGGGRSSGYQRVLLSPGVEFDFHPWSIYADVELPLVQDFVGNQLAAPFLFKFYVNYMF